MNTLKCTDNWWQYMLMLKVLVNRKIWLEKINCSNILTLYAIMAFLYFYFFFSYSVSLPFYASINLPSSQSVRMFYLPTICAFLCLSSPNTSSVSILRSLSLSWLSLVDHSWARWICAGFPSRTHPCDDRLYALGQSPGPDPCRRVGARPERWDWASPPFLVALSATTLPPRDIASLPSTRSLWDLSSLVSSVLHWRSEGTESGWGGLVSRAQLTPVLAPAHCAGGTAVRGPGWDGLGWRCCHTSCGGGGGGAGPVRKRRRTAESPRPLSDWCQAFLTLKTIPPHAWLACSHALPWSRHTGPGMECGQYFVRTCLFKYRQLHF